MAQLSTGRPLALAWRMWSLVLIVILASAPLQAGEDEDLIDLRSGGLVLSATTQYGGRWNAQALVDGSNLTGWSSAKGYPYPNEFLIELPRRCVLASFVIDNTGAEESNFPGISARHFALYGSAASKYEVVSELGSGWEGEVYKIREIRTGIDRAAKLFYPQRNIGNRTAKRYAKKLHRLRYCTILIQYHTEELIEVRGVPVTVLISEYVEGELLSDFLKRFPGNRLQPFEALHLLYALAKGMEQIHLHNEYHGDLHLDNIIIKRFGLTYDLKLIDLFHE